GDGVEHDDVDRVGADERLHDVERVLAAVGLGNEEVVELYADDAGVFRVERVLDVDERSEAAFFLRLGDDTEAKGGFARGFRAVDFDDAALGQAADAEREVDGERAGGERLDLHLGRAAEAHDGAFAELFRDGGQREFDVLFTHMRGGRGSGRLNGGNFGHVKTNLTLWWLVGKGWRADDPTPEDAPHGEASPACRENFMRAAHQLNHATPSNSDRMAM